MTTEAPLIYLIAGEPSGDRLGARLMAALKAEHPGPIRFRGIGGEMMAREGLTSLFPITDLAVMGLAEVLPRLPRLLRRIRETVDDVVSNRPAILVTIDAPDFGLRVARQASGKGIPLLHYVAPSVWAWKAGRARKMAAYLDGVMTLLPFEPAYFTRAGLAAEFVGHPVLESDAATADGWAFRARHGIARDARVACLLPGSRAGEIDRLMPVLRQTMELLGDRYPDLSYVLPTVSHMEARVRKHLAGWSRQPLIVIGEAQKFDAFAASNVAIAASGTVALELAMARTPNVIIYKMNPVTSWLARKLVKSKYVNLVNILLDEEAVPELLLEDCRPEWIADEASKLLSDAEAVARQRRRLADALAKLSRDGLSPSRAAAQAVLRTIKKGRS
jgi:lipid-A-disaccharide synthase